MGTNWFFSQLRINWRYIIVKILFLIVAVLVNRSEPFFGPNRKMYLNIVKNVWITVFTVTSTCLCLHMKFSLTNLLNYMMMADDNVRIVRVSILYACIVCNINWFHKIFTTYENTKTSERERGRGREKPFISADT